jgi:hypothetical protein
MNKLTVLFEEPFWVGIFEKVENDKIEVFRVIFGQEPKDYEIYEFILKNYYNLKFSEPLEIDAKTEVRVNPKRILRKIFIAKHNAKVHIERYELFALLYSNYLQK